MCKDKIDNNNQSDMNTEKANEVTPETPGIPQIIKDRETSDKILANLSKVDGMEEIAAETSEVLAKTEVALIKATSAASELASHDE